MALQYLKQMFDISIGNTLIHFSPHVPRAHRPNRLQFGCNQPHEHTFHPIESLLFFLCFPVCIWIDTLPSRSELCVREWGNTSRREREQKWFLWILHNVNNAFSRWFLCYSSVCNYVVHYKCTSILKSFVCFYNLCRFRLLFVLAPEILSLPMWIAIWTERQWVRGKEERKYAKSAWFKWPADKHCFVFLFNVFTGHLFTIIRFLWSYTLSISISQIRWIHQK